MLAAQRISDRVLIAATARPMRLVSAAHNGIGPPRFSMIAYDGAAIWQGHIRGGANIVVDLSSITAQTTTPVLRDHDETRPVGTATARLGAQQIAATGLLNMPGRDRDTIVQAARDQFSWQVSIGVDPGKLTPVPAGQSRRINGRTIAGPFLHATQNRLLELSITAVGANTFGTSLTVAASARLKDLLAMPYSEWLTLHGYNLANMTDAEKVAAEAKYITEQTPADPTPPAQPLPGEADPSMVADPAPAAPASAADPVAASATAMIAAAHSGARQAATIRAAAIRKQNAIEAAAVGNPEIAALALENDWSLDRVELEVIKASRTSLGSPAVHTTNGSTDLTTEVLQAGLMLRNGHRLDNPNYSGQTIQARRMLADSPWLLKDVNDEDRQKTMNAAHAVHDMSLEDFANNACRIAASTGTLDRKYHGQIPTGREERIRAAFSSGELLNIFSTNVNAVVLDSFLEYGDVTRAFCKESDVANYQLQERTALTKAAGLEKLPRGKTAELIERSDRTESFRIARYASQFVIDEMDIADDIHNALEDVPRDMAIAAARLRPDLVAALHFANDDMSDGVALFHADHNNLNTTTPLASAGLATALTAFRTQTENGVALNHTPTHIYHPSALEFDVDVLINSSETRDTTSSTHRGTMNPMSRQGLSGASEPRLDNGVTDPASGTAHAGNAADWYLHDAKNPAIEVAYKRGTGRAPSVRAFTLDQGSYGAGYDVTLDIGVKAINSVTIQKNDAA